MGKWIRAWSLTDYVARGERAARIGDIQKVRRVNRLVKEILAEVSPPENRKEENDEGGPRYSLF